MDFIVETKKIERPDIVKGLNRIIENKKIRKDFTIPLEIARLQKETELLLKEQALLAEEIYDLTKLANKGEHGKIKDNKTE